WDRHLHHGLSEEHARRGSADRVRQLPVRVWSLQGGSGDELVRGNAALFEAGVERVKEGPWPPDLGYVPSSVGAPPQRLFAGREGGRAGPWSIGAIRDLPYEVHLVTGRAPAGLPANARVDARLPLWRFRDALAACAVAAIPLAPGGASGVTVVPMAMALGV